MPNAVLEVVEVSFYPTAAQEIDTNATILRQVAVKAGDSVLAVEGRLLGNWHASATMSVGDGSDDDGFMTTAEHGVTAGIVQGGGAYLAKSGGKCYTVADTIDFKYTGHAAATYADARYRVTILRNAGSL
jgi:hypothetical protein